MDQTPALRETGSCSLKPHHIAGVKPTCQYRSTTLRRSNRLFHLRGVPTGMASKRVILSV